MNKFEATTIATAHGIPLGADFHTLPSETVDRILQAADERKYIKPKNANGSRARYFYAMLTRANNSKVNEYVVQGYYGQGWEDLTSASVLREAKADIKAYRENAPGNYRLITRRVPA